MIEIWVFFAILAALAQAGTFLLNEYFKVRSIHLLFWMRLFNALMLLPAAFFIPWPSEPIFYILVLMTSIMFAYNDVMYFGLVAKVGAGVVSRIQPLEVGLTFVLWVVISPWLITSYMEEPLRALGIVAALFGSIYFSLRLRRCKISQDTFRFLLPAICIGGVGIVISSTAMQHSDYVSGVFWYAFLQSILGVIIYTVVFRIPALSDKVVHLGTSAALTDKRVIIAGLCMALGWLIHTPSKYFAISSVENPAYVTVIGLTGPFWILLIYKLIRRREEADVISGLGIVVCAILLVIFTQL